MSKRGWHHVDDPILVGRRLREARQQAGLSQRELAFPGCTAVYICRIEKGQRVPSLQVLRELAMRLDVPELWLSHGTDLSGDPLERVLTLIRHFVDLVGIDDAEVTLHDIEKEVQERIDAKVLERITTERSDESVS